MTKQLNIRLSEEALKELRQMQTDLKLPSIAEVIRSSISLQRFLELEKQAGNDIVLRDKQTNKERVLVIR